MLQTAGVLFLLYYAVICVYVRRWNATFSRVWLFSGIVLIFAEVCRSQIPETIKIISAAAGTVFCAAFFFIFIRMVFLLRKPEEKRLDYLIVLGAKVDGRRITISLRLRLEKAFRYLQENPDTKAIVSGGKGKGEDISEAEAMASYLEEAGILKSRIVREGKSTSTEENMKYSIEEVPDSKKKRTGVVTNSFHMYRAVMLGKYVGYENLYPVTAKSEPVLFLNYLLREILAVLVFPVRRIWKAGKMSIDK